MLIKHRVITVSLLLLCLFLSLLILNTLNFTESEVVLENNVEEEVKFLSENSNSIMVKVYGNSSELNSANAKVDVVLDATMIERIESLSENAISTARDSLIEAEQKDIKPASEMNIEEPVVEEIVVEETVEVSNYMMSRPTEKEEKNEENKKEEKKEEVVSTPSTKNSNTTINVVPSIDNENNVVIDSNSSDVITTTRGKFTFTYDPTVVPVNMENLESRFAVFAPNDNLNKVVKALSQMAFGEARGCADTEIAATIWCVLNRYDAGYANSIFKVVSAPNQFHGYKSSHKVYDDIYEITMDVIARWVAEKEGATNVGRILPSDYLWFAGDGKHNHYRNEYKTSNRWDWSLPTPYIDWE